MYKYVLNYIKIRNLRVPNVFLLGFLKMFCSLPEKKNKRIFLECEKYLILSVSKYKDVLFILWNKTFKVI